MSQSVPYSVVDDVQIVNLGSDFFDHNMSLFKSGRLSDVTVAAFGREWKLHKNFLDASPYFSTLFTENSDESVFRLEILDPKVNIWSLDLALGSFYSNKIVISKENVVSLTIIANIFQMEALSSGCYDFMLENLDVDSAVEFYYSGGEEVQRAALDTLKILLVYQNFVGQLDKIEPPLMERLAGFADLTSLNEYALLNVMILWLYTKICGFPLLEDEDYRISRERAKDFFREREDDLPFLSTSEGEPFVEAFRQIRFKYLLSVKEVSLQYIQELNIFPKEWIDETLVENFETLKENQADSPERDVDFFRDCQRVGFAQNTDEWSIRVCDYLMGIQLICKRSQCGTSRVLVVKRVTGSVEVYSNRERCLQVCMKVVATDNFTRIIFTNTTELQRVWLQLGGEMQIMELGQEFDGKPIKATINFLF